MLIETGERKILVDTGLGDKQDEKFRSFFYPHGEDTLFGSIEKAGLQPGDITDVFITHHHFDHNGGAVIRDEKNKLVPAFPNATYWSNKTHWEWSANPNAREKASFLKENFIPLAEHGVVEYIDETQGIEWLPGINIEFCYGHTEAMMLLDIDLGERHLIYCADLMPSSYHIGMPYVMAYDIRPLQTLKEKGPILERAVERKDILFFEHDPFHECGTVKRNEKGRIVIDQTFSLEEAVS
jgi:glyoxylase-like metal-dependent hydrolase (beta-lactamase superfamily II)